MLWYTSVSSYQRNRQKAERVAFITTLLRATIGYPFLTPLVPTRTELCSYTSSTFVLNPAFGLKGLRALTSSSMELRGAF